MKESIMHNLFFSGLLPTLAIIIGGIIGIFFGSIQNAALLRNKKLQENGKLKNGWLIMPGSFSRIAILLIVLIIIQIGIPVFFEGNFQWLVSAGILIGYGLTFVKKLKQRASYRN